MTQSTSPPDPMLSVRGLTKQFEGSEEATPAVDGVSFDIQSNSAVGLLGPNGAGKTTTIKCLLGMVEPDAGDIRIHGVDARTHPRECYKYVDAMLEGARNDYWRLTVRENLAYFSTINGVNPRSIRDQHDRLLDRFGILDQADTPVRNLSRGMKQKVSIASVLAGSSKIVFLDEPTLGLDVESSITLRHELNRIIDERNLTVLLSSHDLDTIETVCDRFLIMQNGTIQTDDNTNPKPSARGVRVISSNFTDQTVQTLQAATNYQIIHINEDTIEARVTGDQIYQLMDHLKEHGIQVDAINSLETSLEDLLLQVTSEDN